MPPVDGNPVSDIVRLRGLPSVHTNVLNNAPLFVYCSTPRPIPEEKLGDNRCTRPVYRDGGLKPKGMHSYYNIAWDPRVRRGDPLQKQKKEQEELEKIRRKLAEPRKRPRKITPQLIDSKPTRLSEAQGMIRAANLRYGRLAISNLRPKDKDTFLVELREEVDQDEICYKGQRIGAARILPKVPSKKRNLVDQFTQIWPDEFFNFDLEVIPVLERLVGSVCYRARLEVLEEEEMKALEMQRKVFEEQKRKEEDDYNKYKNRVEMHMAEEKRQTALAAKLHRDEMNGDINTTLFAGVYIRYSYHEGVRASGEESQLRELVRLAVKNEAVSWLNAEVEKRVAQYRESTQLLDDIIRNAVADKEARIAGTMLGFPDEMETRVPPPTPGEFTDEEGFPAMPKNYPSWASGQED